jgi:predicted amidohydrolase
MSAVPNRPLRIALAQTVAKAGDVDANLADALTLIHRAADDGAALIAYPELSLTGYELGFLAETRAGWFTADDVRLEPVRRTCAERRITAVLGAAVLDDDGTPRLAALVVGPGGGVDVWCKQHLHGAENALFRPRDAGPPFTVEGWQVSLAICFDAAQPAHASDAARRGADLYLTTALYARGEERRADLHFGARAMDHRMFAALANFAGTTGGHASIGGSGVWRPSGDVLRRAPDADPALVFADLDPDELRTFRAGAQDK